MYVWTKKAEKEAKDKDLPERKAGKKATVGGLEVFGPIAIQMIRKGYVEEVDDESETV